MEDPFPDLHELFRLYSDIYFGHPPGALDGCFVEWSSRRMTMCCADPCPGLPATARVCVHAVPCCALLLSPAAPLHRQTSSRSVSDTVYQLPALAGAEGLASTSAALVVASSSFPSLC